MAQTAYDEVAYPSEPFTQTHPLRLALPAALFGLDYAPAETARILEIGCGEGGNIIPLAVSYPKASIMGFDLAPTAIAAGREIVEELGLTNIRLEALDILNVGAELGQFDYIIAHGVYSWVPEPVREGVLRVIQQCLAPDGLAFVSYNALPGCHLRLALREMLLHHLQGATGFEARLARAREFLQLFIDQAPDNEPAAVALKAICREMLGRNPHVLFHDELGEVYQPFYLQDFVAQAGRHGLAFLAETEGAWWREELFPSSRGRAIAELVGRDPVQIHQYTDFIVARLFRQTILDHASRITDRQVDPARIGDLWISGVARAAGPDPDLVSKAPVRFELRSGAIALDHPGLKTALHRIGQAWPGSVAVADLPDEADVREGLLQLFTAGHLELTVGPSTAAAVAQDRPLASPLVRLQLARGMPKVCNLDHMLLTLEDEDIRRFVSLLDGRRARAELAAQVGEGEAVIDHRLNRLAQLGLLIA